jgi:WD40 repeat protein/serine/threonine protein kinase
MSEAVRQEVSLESLVAEVADDFLERQRRGEHPDVEEYAARHPQAAEMLRKVLASLQLVGVSADGGLVPGKAELPARELGDFRIVREVGRGGMGVVYEAEQISLGRRVALKVLPFAATMDPRQLQRFHNEARAAACLHHEHIVPVFGVGCERGVHFYAMQFIDGHTLAEVIARQRGAAPADTPTVAEAAGAPSTPTAGPAAQATGPAPRDAAYFRRVAEWGAQAAEALEHAHALGVVHRDVKPANLMLDGRGKLWVADFGLARVGSEPGVTMTGDLLGTLRYMSPEQALAKHGLVDHRTDVYALGATLYELLALRPAVDGRDREEILRRIAFEDPVPLTQADRGIPADLETVVLKALAKEPSERYATAQELADDLAAFLQDKPIRARRPTLGERAAKWVRRHRAVAATGVLGLVLAVAILGASTALIWGKNREIAEQSEGLRREKQATEEALAQRTEALGAERWALYLQRVAAVDRDWRARSFASAERVLAQCPPELRHWEWHYLNRHCRKEPPGLDGMSVAFASDDGRRFAAVVRVTGVGDRLKVWDTASGRVILDKPTHSSTSQLTFDPRGRKLAVPSGFLQMTVVNIWDLDTGRVQCSSPPGRVGGFSQMVFSPDGRYLATAGADRIARVWDVATWKEVLRLRGHAALLLSVAFSPDGKRLATAGFDGVIKLWDRASGKVLLTLPGHSRQATRVVFSPDGRRLASAGCDRTVRAWDAATGREVLTLLGHGHEVYSVAFSPDGRRLVSTDSRSAVLVWDAQSGKALASFPEVGYRGMAFYRDGDHLVLPLDPAPKVIDVALSQGSLTVRGEKLFSPSSVAFGPGGARLAIGSYDLSVRVVDAASGRVIWKAVHAPHQSPRQVAFSPDGKRVASGGGAVIKLWDAQTGAVVRTLTGHSGEVSGVAFSPDGSRLASVGDAQNKAEVSVGGEVKIWDLATGREAWAFHDGPSEFLSVAYSPDGTRLAVETDGAVKTAKVRVWDLTTGQPLPTLGSPHVSRGSRCRVVFSRDGERIAWSPGDGNVVVSDARTGRKLFKVPGHRASFSPDGRRLATARDALVRLWGPRGEEVLALRGHTWPATDVAFSPDGTRLASASVGERVVKVWDGTP